MEKVKDKERTLKAPRKRIYNTKSTLKEMLKGFP